jgi:catechol 2,3-dioxygenase-like lactoylglutathione lyase family enzyme
MANVMQITPFMHVEDLDAAVDFFVKTIGFTCEYREANYAYVALEGAGIRILAHCAEDDEIGVPHRGFAYYVDVRDLEPILARLQPALSTFPVGDVHGPVDQPYGQRELLIRAPDGNLLVFGQPIAR